MSPIKEIFFELENARKKGCLYHQSDPRDDSYDIVTSFYKSGQIKFKYTLLKGQPHRSSYMWSLNGQLLSKDNFNKGKLHGPSYRWFENGQIKSEINYLNGAYVGTRKEYYENGQIYFECHYVDNKCDGISLEWHANGMIKEKGNYLEGKRHGIFREYNDRGKQTLFEVYIRGMQQKGRIPRKLEKNKLTSIDILRIQNTALRRICLEDMGYNRFLAGIDYLVLDKRDDEQLIRVDWNKDEEPMYLVKVKCPSTGVYYTLRVPPTVTTVQEAVAWTFGLTSYEYIPTEQS